MLFRLRKEGKFDYARKEVLKRLLELNHKIRKDKEDQGLWSGKGSLGKPTKPKAGGK